MIDPPILLALALLAAPALALAPLPAAFAALSIAFLLRSRATRRSLLLALAALLLAGLRARAALDGATHLHERMTTLLTPPARCEAEAVVVSSPVVLRGHGPVDSSSQDDRSEARADIEIERGICGDRAIDRPFRARVYGAPEGLARGDRIAVVVDLAPVHLFANPELTDPRPGIARSGVAASGGLVEARLLTPSHGPPAWIDRARTAARRRIEATYHPEANALGRALVLGETDLDPADDEAFRASGLSHLLAVSGTHLVIAVAGFAAALRALLLRVPPLAARMDVTRLSSALAIPAAFFYADFAGGSGSALRAAAMLGAAMLTRALGRRAFVARTFAWSILVLALLDPLLATDLSFALSTAATAGLVLFQRPIASVIVTGPAPIRALLSAIATTLAAMAGCTPILTLLAPTLPLLGILANLLAAPLGELLALPLCLVHTLLAWAPPVEQGAAILGSGALLGVRAVALATAATGATVALPPPTALQLALLAVTASAAFAAPDARRRLGALLLGALALGAAEIGARRAGAPEGLLRISVLDVGQGDAALIDLPDGSAMLLDGGGFIGSPVDTGKRVILPVLRARRRDSLALVVLSHPHPDHFGGLVTTLPSVNVGALWDTGQGEDQGAGPAYTALLQGARDRHVPILRPADLCGAPHPIGGALIEVLAPCPGFAPDRGANDNSFVLRITHGKRSALLVGDAEHEEEDALLHRPGLTLRADFLKVGHHGSRTSTSKAFLAAVAPSFATISSGVRNRFGHPHPRTLATLEAQGVPFSRTDRGGQIVWETDGDLVRVLPREP
ncbi:MAG: DNA internalization-related competence protein ComEC/Rec2 [Byssovorax sp.]